MNKLDKIIFFSPHLDDAIFSCGGAIVDFLKKNHRIIIVTVFSGVPDYDNLSAFASKIATTHWVEKREKENRELLLDNKIEFINLGFLDTIFRKNDFGNDVCLSWKDVFTSNSDKLKNEKKLYDSLNSKISDIINCEPCEVYFPLAIGSHFDHYLINKIAKINNYSNIIYYEDLPYAADNLKIKKLKKNYRIAKIVKIDINHKLSLIYKYKIGLGVGGNASDTINSIKNYSLKVSLKSGPSERFWRNKK